MFDLICWITRRSILSRNRIAGDLDLHRRDLRRREGDRFLGCPDLDALAGLERSNACGGGEQAPARIQHAREGQHMHKQGSAARHAQRKSPNIIFAFGQFGGTGKAPFVRNK